MKGDKKVVEGEAETLFGLSASNEKRSDRFLTVYGVLRQLLESKRVNELLRDFHDVIGVPVAIVDLDANVLAASNWERLCTNFNRANVETCQRCVENDIKPANRLGDGSDYTIYRCGHGLTDYASPIVIEGEHVANLFVGQLLLDPPDEEFFTRQARKFGFPEDECLTAANEVQALDESRTAPTMNFLVRFAQLIANMGMEQLRCLNAEERQRRYLETKVSERTEELERKTEQLTREMAKRERTEKLLQESERRLLEAQRLANVGNWELDLKDNGLVCSDELLRLFETDRQQLSTGFHSFLKVVHPDDRERVEKALTHSLKDPEPFSMSYRLQMLDGRIKHMHAQCRTFVDDQGQPVRSVGTMQDVTERTVAEIELRDYRDHLEKQVCVRTAELQSAKDTAESASRAKSAFLANMSHELRTPLNAILGFAQLMEGDERIPEDRRSNLATIKRSGEHLLSLIDDVLDISRVEAGHSAGEMERFDLHDVLSTVAGEMRVGAQRKGLSFLLNQADNVPRYVRTDATKLHQILINLVSNAVKFTKLGKIEIDVGVEEGEQVVLTVDVSDTGVGIAPADLDRVFEAFFQTRHGLEEGGTGLGLAISKEHAELLRGSLHAESSPNHGSVFRLRLPIGPASQEDAKRRDPGRVTGLADDQPACRILVAEDNPDNQRLAVALLEGVGFEVLLANDGNEAVELARTWHPHCIFMDMRMPVVNGYEATRRIRKNAWGVDVKIIALTASAFEDDRAEILAAGCDAFVGKPIQMHELFGVVEDMLGVSYRYADVVPTEDLSPSYESPNLQELSATLLSELEQATLALDVDGIHSVIDQIHNLSPPIASALRDLTDEYQFDAITAAIESTR